MANLIFWIRIFTRSENDTGNKDQSSLWNVFSAVMSNMQFMQLSKFFQFELPPNQPITVSIGIDIKDIPSVSDKDFSITLNAYFIVKWFDSRLLVEDILVRSNRCLQTYHKPK